MSRLSQLLGKLDLLYEKHEVFGSKPTDLVQFKTVKIYTDHFTAQELGSPHTVVKILQDQECVFLIVDYSQELRMLFAVRNPAGQYQLTICHVLKALPKS